MLVNVPFRVMTSSWEDFCQAVRSASPLVVTCLVLMLNAETLHHVHNVLITRKFNDYRFELVYLDGPTAGTPWVQQFCGDSELTESKGFAPGFILDEMGFVDRVDCWSTNPDLQGYWFNRKNADGSYVRQQ